MYDLKLYVCVIGDRYVFQHCDVGIAVSCFCGLASIYNEVTKKLNGI